jgi:hypothetical protein
LDNVDFFIKRGDRSPAITAILKDKNGAAIDLTGKAVRFHMRSFMTGALIVDSLAAVNADQVANRGKVSYAWAAGDTNVAGYNFAEWEVQLAPGVTQTFPTIGWHLIEVTSDLDDAAVVSANFVELQTLRRLVSETGSTDYSDSLLNAMLLQNEGDLDATAAAVWREKAAAVAGLVDVSESGSSRKMSQLHDRYVKQAETYESRISAGVAGAALVRPKMNRIVRADR